VGLLPTEALEGRLQVRPRAGAEVLPCGLKQRVLEALDRLEIDGRRER
jgi:hypothetical protein